MGLGSCNILAQAQASNLCESTPWTRAPNASNVLGRTSPDAEWRTWPERCVAVLMLRNIIRQISKEALMMSRLPAARLRTLFTNDPVGIVESSQQELTTHSYMPAMCPWLCCTTPSPVVVYCFPIHADNAPNDPQIMPQSRTGDGPPKRHQDVKNDTAATNVPRRYNSAQLGTSLTALLTADRDLPINPGILK